MKRGNMEVTAAVVRKFGDPFSIEQLTLGPPRSNEVVIRLVATGLCHTDINARAGGMPVPVGIVLGHEGAGVVEEVGSAIHHVMPGDHVVLTVDSCGTCRSCQLAQPAHCEDLFSLNLSGGRPDGSSAFVDERVKSHFMGQSSLATRAVVSGSSVIGVRRDVPLELLGPLGCGVQTGAGTVMRALRVTAGSSVAIFGAGAVGLSAVVAAAISGASCIVAVDRVPSRLEMAKRFGATETLLSGDGVVDAIRKASLGGVDYAIECAGSPDTFSAAVDSLRSLGHCAVVGGVKPGTRASYDWRPAQGKGITIHSVVEGDVVPSEFIPVLVDLVAQRRFPLEAMVRYYDFDQLEEAVQAAESGEVIKPILRMPA
jgi:aryl-alcohol dehydrogenase